LIIDWTLRLGWILVAWLFALGGGVGSFLNVVVYRMPRGKSIVLPGSACPACGHPIRWYDNLPILSWLILGGRCRDCRVKISPRYPLVELVMAVLFAGLFLVDARPRIIAIAESSPAPASPSARDVLIRYVADLWLLSTLLCAALVEFDGARVPRRLFALAAGLGVAAAAAFPASRQDAFSTTIALLAENARGRAIAAAIVGMIAGCAIGCVLDVARIGHLNGPRESMRSSGFGSAAYPLLCVGAVLGWFGAIAVAIAAVIEIAVARLFLNDRVGRSRFGWSGAALIGAVAWIVGTS
jgi:leader peptidase (prepilin peptidase) / N-methyltransferase